MIACVLLISFFLEGIFTNLIGLNSLLLPAFAIVSLTIIYPYFNSNDARFMGCAVIMGLFYDLIYTNSLFVNTFSFVIVSIAIVIIYNYINMNWININVLNIVMVILYRMVSYMILCLVGYHHFTSNVMMEGIYKSLIINAIYGVILYFIIYFIGKKLGLKKME